MIFLHWNCAISALILYNFYVDIVLILHWYTRYFSMIYCPFKYLFTCQFSLNICTEIMLLQILFLSGFLLQIPVSQIQLSVQWRKVYTLVTLVRFNHLGSSSNDCSFSRKSDIKEVDFPWEGWWWATYSNRGLCTTSSIGKSCC